MCAFRDMYGELQGMKAAVVGISVDAPFAQKAFAEKHDLTFTLLCDFKREVISKFGVVWRNLGGVDGYVSANRAIFVVNDAGMVTYRWVAESPGNLPNFDEVRAAVRPAA